MKEGYKEVKHIGRIPIDWQTPYLGDIVKKKIVYGIVQAGPPQEQGIPYIRSTDVGGAIDTESLLLTTEKIASKYSRSEVKPGDIVFSLRGNIGETSIVPDSLPVANLTQGTARISIKDEYSNRYVVHVLSNSTIKKYISAISKGSTFKEITLEDLRKIRIPIPPNGEDRTIAKTLDKWDQASDFTKKLVAEKKFRRKGLMQQLLTGKRRLPGFDGEWRECEIGSLFKEINRPVTWDDDELYRLISVRRRSGGLFQRESLYGHQILTKNLKTVHTGDYLISKMQVLHGATGLVTPEFNGMKVSGSYISLIPRKPAVISTEFFSYFSQLPSFYHLTYLASYGVHIEKMTFNLKWFMQSKLTIPPSTEEQTAIVKFLKLVDQEIDLLLAKADALREQKKGLMQKLLTGKIRVNAGGEQQ